MCYTNLIKGVFMKKLFCLICLFCISHSVANASYTDLFIADIEYDWINKSMVEKESIINEISEIIFEEQKNLSERKELKSLYKDKLNDKMRKEHYFAASAGHKEYGENNLSAFYYKKQKHIYMYALQNKKDISKIYYYDALGNLKYVDEVFGEYPDYPYYTIQYRITGKPVCASYYISKDTQYIYEPDGTFRGVWYKHNLYDKHSKVILTRTSF